MAPRSSTLTLPRPFGPRVPPSPVEGEGIGRDPARLRRLPVRTSLKRVPSPPLGGEGQGEEVRTVYAGGNLLP